MKIVLMGLAFALIFWFVVVCFGTLINPIGNAAVPIPWEFPMISIVVAALIEIIQNQENILHRLNQKNEN